MNSNYFSMIERKYIDALKADVSLLEHKKTKAQVLILDNKNENKTFSIGFRTPPEDSTGVAHIVEHCVLSGSRKYPTKEPFMDMISSSMQTFLNAMTYPDKTLYPISSRNDKDFRNLMDVYLDAVFYPRMYEEKNIFYQEGWHPEIQDGKLIYNGVVYNEMKGVYGDPANQVSDLISARLHPTGTYSHDSGGNPSNIPDLTYEGFLDFHRRYYHPSNAYLLLAGDMDFEEVLNDIHEDYLGNFDYQDPKSDIILSESFDGPREFKETYSISKEEYKPEKSYFSLAYDFGDATAPLDFLKRSFLAEILVNSDDGILKKKVLEAGIGEDVYVELSSSQSLDFKVIVQHVNPEDYPKFKEIIETTLKDIGDKGMDEDVILANLNKFEFSIRQGGGAMKDLISYIQSLNSWLYGGSPLEALSQEESLEDLRREALEGKISQWIEDWMLNNPNQVHLMIEPEIDKHHKLEEKEAKERGEKLSRMTEDEKNRIVSDQEALVHFQMTPDSPEAKAQIPKLELEDIQGEVAPIPRKIDTLGQTKVVINEQPTQGISYYTLAFDLNHLDRDDLVFASILSEVYTLISTRKRDTSKLNTAIYLNTGGIKFNTEVINKKNHGDYVPQYMVSTGILDHNIPRGLEVLGEVILETVFSNQDEILEALYISKNDMESNMLASGHSIISHRVTSYFSKSAFIRELTGGLDLYFELAKLLKDFDPETFEKRAEALVDKLFTRSRLVVNYVGDGRVYEENKSSLEDLLNKLPQDSYDNVDIPYEVEAKNEAFMTSSPVQYVSAGYDFTEFGLEYSGVMDVLTNVISNQYLHNYIRAKGGAYGSGLRMARTGRAVTYSYRDPHLNKTLEVYRGIGDFIRDMEISDRDLKDYIIGVMNNFDPHMAPPTRGALDFKRYLSGVTQEDINTWRQEALHTTVEDLKSYDQVFDQIMDQNFYAVIGNERKIEENKGFFKSIEHLRR